MKYLLLAVLMAINVAAKADIPGAPSYAQWKQSLDWGADPAYSNYLFDYGYQANGNQNADLAGLGYQEVQDKSAGNQMTLNSLGVMFNPATGHYYLDTAGGVNSSTGWGTPDASTGLIDVGTDLGAVSSYATSNRNKNYTGGDFVGGLLDKFGPMLPIMFATSGIAGMGAGGVAGDAYMPAALGTDGLGSVGAAGSGLAGDAYMPAALGSDGGLTSSLGVYNAPTAVAGSSTMMPYEPPIPTNSGLMPTEINPLTYTGPSLNINNIPTGNVFDPTGQNSTGPSGQNPQYPTTNSTGTGPMPNPGQTSAIQRILSGEGTMQDFLSVGGALGGSVLGALGNDAQRSANNSVADKYLQLGAPYRGLLEQSYQPGFTMNNEPGYKDAIDASTNSFLRAASAGRAPGVSGGNPMDNPGAWAETQKYVTANTALPQLNTYRSQLGSLGQLGTNTAGTANLNAAAGAGGAYNAAGYGLGQITNPTSSLDDLLKRFQQMSLPSSTATVNSGLTF